MFVHQPKNKHLLPTIQAKSLMYLKICAKLQVIGYRGQPLTRDIFVFNRIVSAH